MIEALTKYKKALSIVAIIAVAFFGYVMFRDTDSSSSVLTSQNLSTLGAVDNELLSLLINLRSITLDDSLFDDPAFRGLIDFGQQLVPEPTGRQNPFLPVGSDGI